MHRSRDALAVNIFGLFIAPTRSLQKLSICTESWKLRFFELGPLSHCTHWRRRRAFVRMPGGLSLDVPYAGGIDFRRFRTKLKQISKYVKVCFE